MKEYKGLKGGKYFLVQTLPQFEEFLKEALKQPKLAVDTETSGLNWVRSHVCGFVIGWGPLNCYYIPIDHKDAMTGERSSERQLYLEDILEPIQRLLGNPEVEYLFWNAKYDLHMLRRTGIEVAGTIIDGLLASFLLDENGDHTLKGTSNRYIDKNADQWDKAQHLWRLRAAKARKDEFKAICYDHEIELRTDAELMASCYKTAERAVDAVDYEGLSEAQLRRKVVVCVNKLFRIAAKEGMADHFFASNRKDDISYDFIELDTMTPYACADVHYTWVLIDKFLPPVRDHAELSNLFDNETELLRVLFETEHEGIHIDAGYLKDLAPKLIEEIALREQQVYDAIGYKFSIGSNHELIKALLGAGCKLTNLTDKGRKLKKAGELTDPEKYFSVDKEVLELLATEYAFAETIQNYRKLCKLKSTYVDGILDKLDDNCYLHTSINQNVRTGRMSSSNPNVQNIPANDSRIRRAFITPNSEYIFVFIDYSQVELRLTAHYSQDPELLSCYPFEGPGRDVHSLTCADIVMNISYEEVLRLKSDKEGHDPFVGICPCNSCLIGFNRIIAKRTNFGIIYGAGGWTISKQVSTPLRRVSPEECEIYIEGYFEKYAGVKQWISLTRGEILRNGHVQNVFGRYRRFKNVSKLPWAVQQGCFRQGVNFLIQGSAADVFKQAITRVDKIIKGTGIRLVNVVHDEIQFYWPMNRLDLVKDVKAEMEDFDFTVPLVADVSFSKRSWADKKGIAA